MAGAKFIDTMVSSTDLKKTEKFYKAFLGMKVSEKGEGSFVILTDPASGQRLCVVAAKKPSGHASLSIETNNVDKTLAKLEKLGGKVSKRWAMPTMSGANVTSVDGHNIIIWHDHDSKKKAAKKAAR